MNSGQIAAMAFGVSGVVAANAVGLWLDGSAVLFGALLGATASAVSIGLLSRYVKRLGRAEPGHGVSLRDVLVVTAVKLPILAALVLFAARLPSSGLACFLFTIGLVYCATVWYLAASPRR